MGMTQRLNKLEINEYIESVGPLGRINYNEPSNLKITERGESKNLKVTKIGMLAGGTGITPMYQVMQFIHRNRESDKTQISLIFATESRDKTQISLIFANKTEKDILMEKELK